MTVDHTDDQDQAARTIGRFRRHLRTITEQWADYVLAALAPLIAAREAAAEQRGGEATLERVRAVADQHQDGPEGLCTCGTYECDRYEDLRDALDQEDR